MNRVSLILKSESKIEILENPPNIRELYKMHGEITKNIIKSHE